MAVSRRARAGLWIGGGVILLLLVVGATLGRLSGRFSAFGNSHGGSTHDRFSILDDDSEHGRARRAVRDSRFVESLPFFQTLDEREWTAGDCFALGSALLKRDRIILGWSALEAARRIDPKHGPTAAALDELQGKLVLAPDAERARIQESVNQLEMFRAVPGGPPLGMLVLVLARYADNAAQEVEFLDRIWIRDRAELRGLKTTADSIKLGARLLLETGRAVEAQALLAPMVPRQGGGDGETAGAIDREAAWLLSRAALQLDQEETADAMLALAGDYGRSQTARPEPAPFVGSRSCAECHLRLYREQQGTSTHAKTLWHGADLKDVPLPDQPVPDPVIPSIRFSFSRRGADGIAVESRADDRVARAVVEYALGSGRHGITMVAKDEQGVERELRVSYYGEGQAWGETKGVQSAPRDLGDQIGLALGRLNVQRCLHCHATWFRPVDLTRPGPRGPEAADRGIGCERCHGPGLNHIKAVSTGFAELAVAMTAATPSVERLRSCTRCHASDGTVPPSDPEFTRTQGTTFLFSPCYTASKDEFRCTTCHDPHLPVEKSAAYYEGKCLSCHAQDQHRPGKEARQADAAARSCPVNPVENCLACHMPKVEDRSRRASFTDHHIRIHRDIAPLAGSHPLK